MPAKKRSIVDEDLIVLDVDATGSDKCNEAATLIDQLYESLEF